MRLFFITILKPLKQHPIKKKIIHSALFKDLGEKLPDLSKNQTVIGNAVLLTVSSSDGAKSEELKKELTDEVIIELNKLSSYNFV